MPDACGDVRTNPRSPLTVAGVLFGVWVIGLTTLVLTTSNPPQLNWVQLSRARALLIAKVEDAAAGTCRLVRQFTPQALPDVLHVSNLQVAGARTGDIYLLPLVPDVGGSAESFRVVTVPEREIGPLIYPADASMEAQVTAWQSGRH